MKISIRGQEYTAVVDELGVFRAEIGGEVYHDDTLAGLQKKAQAGVKRAAAKIAVPFTQVDQDGRVRHGVATGLHARNRTVLVRWDDNGQADQLSSYYQQKRLTRLTDDETATYARLVEGYRSAARILHAFEEDRKIDLPEAVRKAVDKAVGADA